jgi:hypothetical protein
MMAHIGVDADSGLVHTLEVATAEGGRWGYSISH